MASVLGNRITTFSQNMDPRSLNHVTGISIRSTKGLLLSKTCQLNYLPLTTTSSKINGKKREHSFAVLIKDYASLGPKIIEILKHKMSCGAKIIQFGSQEKIFRKNFSIKEGEKLLQTFECYLYTTVSGGPTLKVSIPLGKINGVNERVNVKRPSNNYVELATVDDYNFWFMGFINSKKTLRCLHKATNLVCLSNS